MDFDEERLIQLKRQASELQQRLNETNAELRQIVQTALDTDLPLPSPAVARRPSRQGANVNTDSLNYNALDVVLKTTRPLTLAEITEQLKSRGFKKVNAVVLRSYLSKFVKSKRIKRAGYGLYAS